MSKGKKEGESTLPWQRIMTVLPVNDADELSAAARAVQWHQQNFGGLTRTIFQPAIYVGYWKKVERGIERWIEDQNSIVFTDVNLDGDQSFELVRIIKETVGHLYDTHNSHQDEIYVVSHELLFAPY